MSKYAVLILPFFIVGMVVVEPVLKPDSAQGDILKSSQAGLPPIETTELLAQNYPKLKDSSDSTNQKPKVIEVLITAYSSSPEETDSTPLITASGSYVRSGVVAANFLPFGTKIRIPEIFGDKIFIVEDRLDRNYNDRIDVWFPSKEEALKFGYKINKVEIL